MSKDLAASALANGAPKFNYAEGEELFTLPAEYLFDHPADGIGTIVVIERWRRLS